MSLETLIKHLQGQHNQASHNPKRGGIGGLQSQGTKAKLANAAQQVLDEWQPDEEGFDDEFGGGGACDTVCAAMNDVISDEFPGMDIYEGGHQGDDHAWSIVHDPNTNKAYGVDIPPHVYEVGGGYSWSKIEGAKVRPEDVDIWEIQGFNPEEFEY